MNWLKKIFTRKNGSEKKKDEKGFILITSMLVIMTLEVYSLALASRNITFINSTERNQSKIVAFNMSDAGVDKALVSLESNSGYTGTSSYTSMNSGSVQGGYSITVATPTGSPTVRLVTTTGYSPDNSSTSRAYEARTIVAYVNLSGGPFDYAIFGDTSLTFSGNATVNSYNSGSGAYSDASATSNGHVASDGPSNISGNGIIKGNVTTSSATLSGNARINGNATTTSGTASLSGNAVITGTTSAGATPALDCEPGSTDVPSSGTLSVQGNTTLTLAAGTYHYSSISIQGNAQVNLTGDVTIYVDGTVNLQGNGITTSSNNPTQLTIIATSNAAINLAGNANFYGAIYAPDSTVSNSGNGELYGAVIAGVYDQSGNGNVHYDQALAEEAAPCSTATLLSWRETNTVAGS